MERIASAISTISAFRETFRHNLMEAIFSLFDPYQGSVLYFVVGMC